MLSLSQSIKKGLEEQHYAVDLVMNGQEALTMSQLISYDLVILDVMLPHIDGFEVCKQLRKRGQIIPILFLTARGDVESRVTGLDLGGDDYLVLRSSKVVSFRRGEDHRERSRVMPKHVHARTAQDEQEESQVRKLARSHHAPADWKFHAQMILKSWAGKTRHLRSQANWVVIPKRCAST